MRWPYLSNPDYHVRQRIAEWFLRDCRTVVEIGPNGNGVKHHGRYVVVDRLSESTPPPESFGLVYLGVDVEGGRGEIDALIAYVQASSVCVLETSVMYEPGMAQLSEAVQRSGKQIAARLSIDILDGGQHSARQMVVLRG